MSKNVLVSILALLVVVVVILASVLYIRTTPEYKYNQAVRQMESGDYAGAIAGFEQLNGYKDSAALIRQASVELLRTRKLNVGDIIEFGDYNGNTTWRVLDIRGSEVMLVSETFVDKRIFHGSSNNWDASDLRSWLNNEYIDEAFTKYERNMIVNKGDEVTLLTVEEADKYFSGPEDRVVPGVDKYGWWLRDPGVRSDKAAMVNGRSENQYIESDGILYQNGDIFEYGGDVFNKRGVRPVIWISLA